MRSQKPMQRPGRDHDGDSGRSVAALHTGPYVSLHQTARAQSQIQLREKLNQSPRVLDQARTAATLSHRSGAVVQAKWVDAGNGLQMWDSRQGAFQWFFNPLTNKLFYTKGDSERSAEFTYEEWLRSWWPGPSEGELKTAVKAGEARNFTGSERELWQRNQMARKGREYGALTAEQVSTGWKGVEGRLEGDAVFAKEYAPFLTFDDMKPEAASGVRGEAIRSLKALQEVTNSGDEKNLKKFYERYKEQLGLPVWEEWKEGITPRLSEIAQQDPYDAEQGFKVGWKGSVLENDYLREQEKPHGSYTGTVNLGKGTLVASGSYRDRDTLNQNEIIFQLWKNAHDVNGLDFWDDRQFRRLTTIVRHNIVNKQLRPVLGKLGNNTFKPGQQEFDLLLSTPNIRAVLFLVKDRGAELGIKGIKSIRLDKGSAYISLKQATRKIPPEYQRQ